MKKRFPVRVVLCRDDSRYEVLENVIAIGFYEDEVIFELNDGTGINTVFYDSSSVSIVAVNDLE